MKIIRRIKEVIALSFLFGNSWNGTNAQPVIYQATGTREQIQATIDQFTHDIVYGIEGSPQMSPHSLGSYNLANFDQLNPGSKTLKVGLVTSGGITFGAMVGNMWLSAGVDDLSNPNRLFGDVDPQYPSLFQPFSGPTILGLSAPVVSGLPMIYAINFSPEKRYTQNAFGAVFSSTGLPAAAALEGSIEQNFTFQSLHFDVPLGQTAGSFSFFGVIFPNQPINGTTIRLSDLTKNPVAIAEVFLGQSVPEPPSLVLGSIGAVLIGMLLCHHRKPRRRVSLAGVSAPN